MTRLDSALVKRALISSRSRAQRAIKLGLVTVNGHVINKSSFQVVSDDAIVVDHMAGMPAGYWKLREIQNACAFINAGDTVLDIGASAGGFVLYTVELAKRVYALEFSNSLKRDLDEIAIQYPGKVTVLHADAFTYEFSSLAGCFDVILNDVTTEPAASLRILERCLVSLKTGGRVLQVLKGKISKPTEDRCKAHIEYLGFNVLCSLTSQKDERFIIGEKKASINAEEGI